MPTNPDDDTNNVGQQHAEDLFDKRGTDAAGRNATETANGMGDSQRARTLRRLEEQARQRKESAANNGTAADDVRQQERRSGWTSNVGNARNKVRSKTNLAKRRLKRWVIGGLITAVLGTAVGVLGILPEKMDILAKQLESKFTSRIEKYTEERSDKMFWRYLAIYFFGNKLGAANCIKAGQPSFTVHSDCFYRENRNDWPKTKLGQMYKVWKENRLEARVLSNTNIHYSPNGLLPNGKRGPTWVVTLPTGGEVPIDPNNPESGMVRAFTTVDQTSGSRSARNALWKQIMDAHALETKSNLITKARLSIHLKNKYGLTRCLFYCELRDRIDEKKVNIGKAWEGVVAQRVVGSISPRAGLFMGCMFQGTQGCTEDNADFQNRYKTMVDNLKAKHGSDKIDNLLKIADDYAKFRAEGGNIGKFIGQKIMAKLAGKITIAGGATFVNALPIIGQIIYGVFVTYEAVTVMLLIYNMYIFVNGAQAQYGATMVKAGLYTAAAATIDTANDERRAAGSTFSDTLLAAQTASISPEDSYLYNANFVDPDSWANYSAASLLGKAAYARTPDEYPIKCDEDGTLLEPNQVVCPGWRFGEPSPVKKLAQELPGSALGEKASQNQTLEAVRGTANEVVETVDAPIDAVSAKVYEQTPKDIKDWLDKNIGKFTDKMSQYIFGVPIKDIQDLTGGKLYDAWYLGKNWTVNDFLRDNGARVATDTEEKAIGDAYQQERREEYTKLSFFEKIFSKENDNSVVSQLALAAPSNVNQAIQVVSPSTAFALIGAIFKGNSAQAAISPTALNAGIPQYVFSQNAIDSEPRDAKDDTPCPMDRTDEQGNFNKKLGDPGTSDRNLGRAEIITDNICEFDEEQVIPVNTSNFTNEPLDTAVTSASTTSPAASGGSASDGVSTGQFDWPIKEDDFKGTTSCYKGPGRPKHYGLDMQGKKGEGVTEIRAADSGTVIAKRFQAGGAGYYVTIQHPGVNGGKTYYTMYMHMPSFKAIRVEEGAKVTKGDVIGVEGNTGGSTGPHLHFTIGTAPNANSDSASINPLKFLPLKPGSAYTKNNHCPVPS